jgi:hypothetical protein
MTISAAAVRGTSVDPQQSDDAQYIPGVCNIGRDEIRRRRRTGHFGLFVSIVVFAALVLVDAPPIFRLIIFLPAAVSASGYIQAYLKFCAGFGQLGVFNFGPRGSTQHVVDKAARAKDRAKARQIGLMAGLIGLAVALAAYIVPI